MKVLVDTNIIIDAMTAREPWNKSAETVILLGANHIVDLYITASQATDIYYLVRKYLHSTDDAKQIMGKLYSIIQILSVTDEDCINAIGSPICDYEDAVVERCAVRNGIEYIITRNVKDYQKGNVKAILPDEFINLSENEY